MAYPSVGRFSPEHEGHQHQHHSDHPLDEVPPVTGPLIADLLSAIMQYVGDLGDMYTVSKVCRAWRFFADYYCAWDVAVDEYFLTQGSSITSWWVADGEVERSSKLKYVTDRRAATQLLELGSRVHTREVKCLWCARSSRGAKNRLKWTVKNEPSRCVECLDVFAKEGNWTDVFVCDNPNCTRLLCRRCVLEYRDVEGRSRWGITTASESTENPTQSQNEKKTSPLSRKVAHANAQPAEWKSSLCGSDGQCELTFWSFFCYYNMFSFMMNPQLGIFIGSEPLGDASLGGRRSNGNVEDDRWTTTIFPALICCPFAIVMDLFCLSVYRLGRGQDTLRERFGLQPRPWAELFLCRWCSLARQRREWALRGYQQPVPCGPSDADLDRNVPPMPEVL